MTIEEHTCYALRCDSCKTFAEDDEFGARLHFDSPDDIRQLDLVTVDPEEFATLDGTEAWLLTDGVHLCPGCRPSLTEEASA